MVSGCADLKSRAGRRIVETSRLPLVRWGAFAGAVYLLAALWLQALSGIYHSELGHYPDEPSHVMSSLMLRDYVLSGMRESPLEYAENYYVHYPKVAIGVWPPFYYITASVWMLLFSATHTSLVVFLALQSAVLALTLALFARHVFRDAIAFGLGLLLIFLPWMQASASMFMVDIFIAILEFWAMIQLVDFFFTERLRSAVLFGLFTSLAMLSKGNTIALLIVPVFLILLTRKFSVLKKRPIYLAGVLIVILGAPWQVISYRLMLHTVPMHRIDAVAVATMFTGYTAILISKFGLPVFLVMMVGLIVECLRVWRHPDHLLLSSYATAGAASLLLGVMVFHCIAPYPGPDERYLLPMAPLLLLFAAFGVRWLAGILPWPGFSPTAKSSAIAGLLLAFWVWKTFEIPHRPRMGFAQAAQLLSTPNDLIVVICSDSDGEGAFITSVALQEQRPRHVILRGSKFLSENPWDILSYRPQFRSPAELEQYLESIPVDAAVIDFSQTIWEQDRTMLVQSLRESPSRWKLVAETTEGPESRHLQVYRRIGPPSGAATKTNIRVKMHLTLGRDLQFHP